MDEVRIIYTDATKAPELMFPQHRDKVFAFIGPFESHSDKLDLQSEIEDVLRKHNRTVRHARNSKQRKTKVSSTDRS